MFIRQNISSFPWNATVLYVYLKAASLSFDVLEMFPHEQTAAFPPPKASWCSFCAAIFPKRCLQMPKNRSVIHFHFQWLQNSRQILMSAICLVPTLLRDLRSGLQQWIPLPRETRRVSWQADHRRDARVMGPNYTLHTLFSHSNNSKKKKRKEIVFFSSCSFPPRLWCVNASTCTRFSGHSEAFKVNTSFTSSSGILSSIIKAESRAICIIPGIRGRPASSSAGHAERMALMKFEEMTFKHVGHLASCKGTGTVFSHLLDFWLVYKMSQHPRC